MAVDPLYEAVAQALLVMEQILPRAKSSAGITPEVVNAWTQVLRMGGVTPEQIKSAVPRLLQTEKFFPTPADFLKLVHPPEDKEAAEELAWQRVLTCLRRHGGRASLTAADLGGDESALWALSRVGFDRMARELSEENRSIWRADFVRLYRTARATSPAGHLVYLPGSWERENLARGYDPSPTSVGRPDWKSLPAERAEQAALDAGRNQHDLAELPPVQRALAESGVK